VNANQVLEKSNVTPEVMYKDMRRKKTMKNRVIAGLLACTPLLALGQIKTEVFYFDSQWQECDSSSARYSTSYLYTDTITKSGSIRTVDLTGNVRSECQYADIPQKKRHGVSRFYHDNGELKSVEIYQDGMLNGELTTFYTSGVLRRKDVYENGLLKQGKCYTSSGKDTTYFDYLTMPQFPGGEDQLVKFLSTAVMYPRKARRKGIAGKVLVEFTVDKTGKVQNVGVERSVHPLLDQEAIRVVSSMGMWTPGLKDGEPFSAKYKLPISFKLQ
jgi:periplasmic protein TonB